MWEIFYMNMTLNNSLRLLDSFWINQNKDMHPGDFFCWLGGIAFLPFSFSCSFP